MPPVMIEPISPKEGRLVSFLFDGDETVSCEVCFEAFQPIKRPPKILPCGHNFCSQCLFSICCHQEYYLLDSINCPTCRRQFSTNTAKNAPTNYDLCKILENVQKGRELNNITVIHVSGFEEPSQLKPNESKKKWKSTDLDRDRKHATQFQLGDEMRKLAGGSKREKIAIKRCIDCKRKVTTKNLAKLARHCEECSINSVSVNFSCLECCVNLHNGHRLYSIQQMCTIKLQILTEVREIRNKTIDAGEQFERRLAELRAAGAPIDSPQLVAAKQNCLNEALSAIDSTIRRLEGKKLLPALMLKSIREAQYAHYTKVSQLNARLEKSVVLPQPDTPSDAKKGLGRMSSFLNASSSSRVRQMRLTVRGDDSLAREALHAITNVLPQNEKSSQLAEIVMRFSPRDTVEHRKQLYLNATSLLTQILYDEINIPTLEMFKDGFLNCFYQLHVLSRKKNDFGGEKKITRKEIWKAIQFAYNELLKIAAKQFPAAHPERIDVIDDLAYLCHLFADICDQATVTICMIEAARARASDSLLDANQRELAHQRLQQIDEHLMDCRRVQKLQQLRSSTNKPKGLKSIFSCLRPATSP